MPRCFLAMSQRQEVVMHPFFQRSARSVAAAIARLVSRKSNKLPLSWRHSTAERSAANSMARISATTPA